MACSEPAEQRGDLVGIEALGKPCQAIGVVCFGERLGPSGFEAGIEQGGVRTEPGLDHRERGEREGGEGRSSIGLRGRSGAGVDVGGELEYGAEVLFHGASEVSTSL